MRLFLLILSCCLCLPAQAQWYKRAWPALSKKISSSNLASSVERKVLQAHYQNQLANQATLKFIRNYSPTWGSMDDFLSSAFVIEENMQGTPRLWGVTVQHYDFTQPAVEHPALQGAVPIEFQAAGQRRYSDVALFALPPEIMQKVTPLKLARILPKPGEEVSSYGYYGKGFQQLRHRIVKAITPARLITTYEFSSSIDRTGACGGPVLNKQNEVVGIHCGSAVEMKQSFVVPVTHIYRLLQAYYHQNQPKESLFFNGKKVYELKVNQAVSRAIALRTEYLIPVEDVALRSYNLLWDPAHVEKLFYTPDLDGILLYIDQTDFTTNKALPSIRIFYDIKTGEIFEGPVPD